MGQLIEREEELDRIEAALDQAVEGTGALMLIEAPPGLGKSALIAAAVGRAGERGMGMTTARGSPLERHFSFGIVRQLLIPQVSERGDGDLLVGPAAAARALLHPDEAENTETEPRTALLHALYWVLVRLSEGNPLLLAIDDAHWADEDSLWILRFLLPRLDGLRLAILAATRPREPGSRAAIMARLALDPPVSVIRPQPLSERGTSLLVRERLGPATASFVRACQTSTGGNPFFLSQLLDDLAERGVEPTDASAAGVAETGPLSVTRWVEGKLQRLPNGATALAQALAVLGDGTDMRLIARLAELDEETAVKHAAGLIESSICADSSPPRFLHPIVRAAIYKGLAAPRRTVLHREAALLLSEANWPLEQVASHYLSTAPGGDRSAVSTLERAAAVAMEHGAYRAAVRYAERALREPPKGRRRGVLLTLLGEAETRAESYPSAESHLREAIREATSPPARARATLALAHAMAEQGRFGEAVVLLESESTRLSPDDGSWLLLVESRLAGYANVDEETSLASDRFDRHARLAGRTRAEREVLATLGRVWAESGRSASECAALASRALRDGRLFGDKGLDVTSWSDAVTVLILAEEIDEAQAVIEAALADARAHGAPLEFSFAAAAASRLALVRGEVSDAEAHARTAWEASLDHRWGGTFCADSWLVMALVERDALDEASGVLCQRDFDRELPENRFFNMLRIARARLRLELGKPDDAIDDLQKVGHLEEACGIRSAVTPWRSELALALGKKSPGGKIHTLAMEELALARTWEAPGCVAVANLAVGVLEGGERGVSRLQTAVSALGRSRRRLDYIRALLALGSALRRLGRRREARENLEKAADLAHHAGATLLSRHALDELIATGARPRRAARTGADALTPMERRIAELVAKGMTNSEVAQALFVTRKNVEGHLHRAYKKLEISDRSELRRALRGGQP